MQIGIVGKANVGKSTFFKAATLAEVEIGNRPFVTIKPNHGTGFIKIECAEKEFNVKCNPRLGYCLDGFRFVPIDLIDVAGLVPGAHEGKGLGTKFLDDLRQADALIHVIDVSGGTNENGEPVITGSYDPANDVKFLEEELDFWYLALITKGWERFARQIKQEKKQLSKAVSSHLSGLGVTEAMMEDAIERLNLPEDILNWDKDVLFKLATELRKITKPMVIICNKMDMKNGNENFSMLQEQFPNHTLIGCSAESELALREAAKHNLIKYVPGSNEFEIVNKDKLNENQLNALEFIKKNVLEKFNSTGVQQALDHAVFELLGYVAIFPGGINKLADSDGRVLPDCFLLKKNSTAIDFAYKLHTDLGKNFIRAIDVRTKRSVGKEHLLKNKDVIEIVANR